MVAFSLIYFSFFVVSAYFEIKLLGFFFFFFV